MADKSAPKTPVVVVAGPTASGKSTLARELALLLDGEVISADSMQLYKGLDIATAKMKEADTKGIPHHMIDIAAPDEEYTVERYLSLVKEIITGIRKRGRIPIVCGGTGLYISSLVTGVDYDLHPYDPLLRKEIEDEYDRDNGEAVFCELYGKDPVYASKLHRNDRKRIIRGVEILRGGGYSPSSVNILSKGEPSYDCYSIVLTAEDRQKLYNRINSRIDRMMEENLLAEAEYVYNNRERFATAVQAIGYKEFFPYFEGIAGIDDCVKQLKMATRRYAKRQITWFKKLPGARFIEGDNVNPELLAEDINRYFFRKFNHLN